MYKRDRQNNELIIIDTVQMKKARKEPLGVITGTLTNMNVSDKCSNVSEVTNNCIQETKMECETFENKVDMKENFNQTPTRNEAFKYNSICDRDRRRHMYF